MKSHIAWECNIKDKGGIFHQRLNIDEKPIVNKYCEGKLKRTLKKEFKEFEVVN